MTFSTSSSSTSKFGADAIPALPGPDWLRRSRLASWERFAGSELPREAEEIWRYSRIEELDLSRYAPCPQGSDVAIDELPDELQALVGTAGPRATVIVSHNGGEGRVLNPQDSLQVVGFGDAPFGEGTPPAPVLLGPVPDIWTAMNGAFVRAPWRVTVAPGAVVEEPLVVVHWLDKDGCAVFPRLEVEVGDNASVRVVEIVASADVDVLSVPMAHLYLRPGARLGFGHVQLLGGRAWQLGNQVSRVGRDATLRSMTVALGGQYARERTDSVLEGSGGDSELLAAFFGAGDQMHDLRTVQHHAAPHTRSDLVFKGAVANKSHSVYSGLIRVEKGAKGTNAFQTNRNLVLSEGAQADSVPTLEIEDNDVRCSHASTVGPIDESQLFYLESRGVPPHAAERLIALGFMEDVLERFPVGGMVGWLRQAVAGKLGSAGFEGPAGPGSG
ncbi:MAG TPA: Fe-S cluster assembly protein SufD [Acidimicrobiales bacterium]|nr:Fe-S cluster assembly protein SufD [Acidimicrobiales bacterium]